MNDFNIISKEVLTQIPSASGLEFDDGQYYCVGDNSPFLFVLNANFQIINQIQIFESQDIVIEKKDKPDFEAMTLISTENSKKLLIFGSGSKSPQRDLLIILLIDNNGNISKKESIVLSEFYQKIRETLNISIEDFNIEAACSNEFHLFLFNRGKNYIIQIEIQPFFDYIFKQSIFPEMKVHLVDLPLLNNIPLGFSGASFWNPNEIIFTASAENTKNWIDDGEVAGSIFGFIDIHTFQVIKTQSLNFKGELLKVKVESVTINTQAHSIVMVTDADGAQSEIIVLA